MQENIETLDISQFWNLTEAEKVSTEYQADKNLDFISSASLPELQSICLQYRFFTANYADDLAILVSRAPPGRFKCEMAMVLGEELGNGDPTQSHLQLYDSFLNSIGIEGQSYYLNKKGDSKIVSLLEELHVLTLQASFPFAVGLRGMGGECLCQIYLEIMANRLHANPSISQIADNIDWRFWDIHAGEEDQIHRERTRELISELISSDRRFHIKDLQLGYYKGKDAFEKFWAISHNLKNKIQ